MRAREAQADPADGRGDILEHTSGAVPGTGNGHPLLFLHSHLDRERLVRAVRAGLGRGVQVVEAPPGYGKSVLAGQLVASTDYHVRHVVLTKETPVGSVAALLAVLAETNGREAADPGAAMSPTAGREARSRIVILDGLEHLARGADTDALEAVVRRPIPGLELVLMGRTLPITALGRAVLSEGVQLLDALDLAMSEREISALAGLMGVKADARAVHGKTGGWPAAVTVALAEASTFDEGSRARIQALWDRYFAEEVLADLGPRHRDLLALLSLLPSDALALAPDLLGRRRWSELQAVFRTHRFLSDLSQTSPVRLHPAIRETLARRTVQRPSPGLRRFARRACQQLVASRRPDLALELAIEAELRQVARAIVAEHGSALLLAGWTSLVLRAVESVGGTVRSRPPALLALRAHALARSSPEEALGQVRLLLDMRDPAPATEAHALAASVLASSTLGQADTVSGAIARLRRLVPELRGAVQANAVIRLAQHAAFRLGRPREALDVLTAVGRDGLTQVGRIPSSLHAAMSECYYLVGDAPNAQRHSLLALQVANPDQGEHFVRLSNNAAVCSLLAGDAASSLTHLNRALAARARVYSPARACAEVTLGEYLLHTSQESAAIEHLVALTQRLYTESSSPRLLALALSLLSTAMRRDHQFASALCMSERAMNLVPMMISPFDAASVQREHALALAMSGHLDSALSHATNAVESSLRSSSPHLIAQTRIIYDDLYAASIVHHKKRQNILESLDFLPSRTISSTSYRQDQTTQANPYSHLQYALISATTNTTDIEELVSNNPIFTALPPRLEKLLPLIAEGLSNSQISSRLNLSLHTVENYVSQLLESFDCANRTSLARLVLRHGRFCDWDR